MKKFALTAALLSSVVMFAQSANAQVAYLSAVTRVLDPVCTIQVRAFTVAGLNDNELGGINCNRELADRGPLGQFITFTNRSITTGDFGTHVCGLNLSGIRDEATGIARQLCETQTIYPAEGPGISVTCNSIRIVDAPGSTVDIGIYQPTIVPRVAAFSAPVTIPCDF